MNKLHPHSEPKLKVATSVVRKEEREGALFYILPPLLVAAVFAFCALSGSPTPAREEVSQGEDAAVVPAGEAAPQGSSAAGGEAERVSDEAEPPVPAADEEEAGAEE